MLDSIIKWERKQKYGTEVSDEPSYQINTRPANVHYEL